MLSPDNRRLYVESLEPPTGYRLDEAIAATFSLDLTTLLTVPAHLALFAAKSERDLLDNGVAVLEAIRRVSKRLTVFCQGGRIHVPGRKHVLYGLLESMIVQVAAPGTGVFHPKFWVLRYLPAQGSDTPLLRLVVLSRNLTADRSWDVSLVVEGSPGGQNKLANRELAELIAALPDLATEQVCREDARVRERTARLADEVRRTVWELPADFESMEFHVSGMKKRGIAVPQSDRLSVVSPFCTAEALTVLADNTDKPFALVARSEELDQIPKAVLDRWQKVMVLDEGAEREDGEDEDAVDDDSMASRAALRGLHAKAYIAKTGWDAHVLVGSANATNAALLGGINVELVAELVGRHSKVGAPEDVLDADGLGAVLVPYKVPEKTAERDPSEVAAEKALEDARREISKADLHVKMAKVEGGEWQATLTPSEPVGLDQVDDVRAWLVTTDPSSFVSALALRAGNSVSFPACSPASLTGLVAFELSAGAGRRLGFVLNLPVTGMPEERDAHVVRVIVDNRDAFLRYLMLLLGELEDDAGDAPVPTIIGAGMGGSWLSERRGLLEELVRARSRDPARLKEVRRVIDDLLATPQGRSIVPPELDHVLGVLEGSLQEAP